MKGGIQKRGQNRYLLTIFLGFNSDGKRIRKTKTVEAKDEKEAAVKLAEFTNELERGTAIEADKMNFAEYLGLWIKEYAEKNLRPKTLVCYKQFIEHRIIPALGHVKLQKLNPVQLMQFYNNLGEDSIRLDSKYVAIENIKQIIEQKNLNSKLISEISGMSTRMINDILRRQNVNLSTAEKFCKAVKMKIKNLFTPAGEKGMLSPSTISKYHRIISSALQDAVQWQLIISNPCERVKPPKVTKKKAAHYEIDTIKKLFKFLELEPIRYRVMVMLAIVTGMRRGEIMALEWKDITGNKIVIEKSMYYVRGTLAIDKTKTESSNRTVHIPQFMIELLDQYKAWQLEDKTKCAEFWQNKNDKSDYLFTTSTGKLMHIDTISSWFADFVKRTELPKLTFHGLRHSAASILLDNGLNLKALSEILGHAEGITTINIYSHKLKTADQQAADIMDKVLGKKRSVGKHA